MNKKGILLVLSGPSGSGKDTVLNELAKDDGIQLSVSMTTRAKRDWEIDGTHYYFVTPEYFKRKIEADEVLEYTVYSGNYYGTPKAAIDEWLNEGKTVVLKIEVEGAANIRRIYPDAVSVFLLPPSMKVLEERLFRRESEDTEEIKRRLKIAESEILQAEYYDYVVVNDVLDYAVSDLRTIISAENKKTSRNKDLINKILKRI
ncbi:MAG: guanylate kinase [Clostridiales bacterium]|nr:guanylate kinase [Clostridiales bacterium]